MIKILGRAAVVMVVAMASAAAPAAAHSHTPQQMTQRIVLTNADDGMTVTAHTGDTIKVTLTGHHEHGLTYTWSAPTTSDPTVLQRTSGGTTPRGDAAATVHAVQPGIATLNAQRRCRSAPGVRCPAVTIAWKVTIEVE